VPGIKELGFAVTDIIKPARPQAIRVAQLAAS
jgi:hypothetical protein